MRVACYYCEELYPADEIYDELANKYICDGCGKANVDHSINLQVDEALGK